MNAKSLSGTHTEQRCQGMALQGETEKAGRPGSCLTWRRPSSPACCWPGGGPRETSPPPAPSSYPAPACSWRGCGAAGPAWRRATSGQLVSAGSTLRCPPACTSSCQFTQVTNYSHQAGRWGGGWGGVGVGGGASRPAWQKETSERLTYAGSNLLCRKPALVSLHEDWVVKPRTVSCMLAVACVCVVWVQDRGWGDPLSNLFRVQMLCLAYQMLQFFRTHSHTFQNVGHHPQIKYHWYACPPFNLPS